MPSMSFGSSTETLGVHRQSTTGNFERASSSVMMANRVISLAVPDVVFTANIGAILTFI